MGAKRREWVCGLHAGTLFSSYDSPGHHRCPIDRIAGSPSAGTLKTPWSDHWKIFDADAKALAVTTNT
jgi:hypothetical protein